MTKRGTLLWIIAALAAWWLAGQRHEPLRAARHDLWPEAALQAIEEAPPLVAFTTVALGGFQGLIADLLWLRVSRLQDQGHYFEIVQLADWITKLEPRFTEVWAYHAWNMAYNISVMFPDPDDRWRWVQHGIHLLRDEGIRYNPADPSLYRELGWIYQHKIGRHWDDANMTYKWNLAQTMSPVLAEGRLDHERAAGDTELRQRLKTEYGLDADAMLSVDNLYGPLDWRAADTHAVYWAWRGLQVAPPEGSLPNERMIFQGMSQAFKQGRIVIDSENRFLITSPDLDLFPGVQRAFTDALERYQNNETIKQAYANFLDDAMTLFFVYGRRDNARDRFEELRQLFPEMVAGETLQTAVIGNLLARMEQVSLRDAAALIEGFFFQAEIYRVMGETDRAAALDRLAQVLWQRAEDRFGDHEATAMPPARALQRQAIERARSDYAPMFRQ